MPRNNETLQLLVVNNSQHKERGMKASLPSWTEMISVPNLVDEKDVSTTGEWWILPPVKKSRYKLENTLKMLGSGDVRKGWEHVSNEYGIFSENSTVVSATDIVWVTRSPKTIIEKPSLTPEEWERKIVHEFSGKTSTIEVAWTLYNPNQGSWSTIIMLTPIRFHMFDTADVSLYVEAKGGWENVQQSAGGISFRDAATTASSPFFDETFVPVSYIVYPDGESMRFFHEKPVGAMEQKEKDSIVFGTVEPVMNVIADIPRSGVLYKN